MSEPVVLSESKYWGFMLPCEDDHFIPCYLCKINKDDTRTFYAHPMTVMPSLKEMQTIVDGDVQYITPSTQLRNEGYTVMYVNEEGRLKGLPENREASILSDGRFGNLVGNAIVLRDNRE